LLEVCAVFPGNGFDLGYVLEILGCRISIYTHAGATGIGRIKKPLYSLDLRESENGKQN